MDFLRWNQNIEDRVISQINQVDVLKEMARRGEGVFILTTERGLQELIENDFLITSIEKIDHPKGSIFVANIRTVKGMWSLRQRLEDFYGKRPMKGKNDLHKGPKILPKKVKSFPQHSYWFPSRLLYVGGKMQKQHFRKHPFWKAQWSLKGNPQRVSFSLWRVFYFNSISNGGYDVKSFTVQRNPVNKKRDPRQNLGSLFLFRLTNSSLSSQRQRLSPGDLLAPG